MKLWSRETANDNEVTEQAMITTTDTEPVAEATDLDEALPPGYVAPYVTEADCERIVHDLQETARANPLTGFNPIPPEERFTYAARNEEEARAWAALRQVLIDMPRTPSAIAAEAERRVAALSAKRAQEAVQRAERERQDIVDTTCGACGRCFHKAETDRVCRDAFMGATVQMCQTCRRLAEVIADEYDHERVQQVRTYLDRILKSARPSTMDAGQDDTTNTNGAYR